jgi:Ser/Thr protein kinase RdoA (MazF antagonist)
MSTPPQQPQLIADWSAIAQAYDLTVPISRVQPIGNGHINDTFVIENDIGQNWILQRINHQIFTQPHAIQQNFDRVSQHLNEQEFAFPILTVIPTRDNQSLCEVNGRTWRIMPEIANVYTVTQVTHPEQAYSAARVVGSFDDALKALPVDAIHTTIEGFHDLSLRLRQFNDALTKNINNRRQNCLAEIDCVVQYAHLADWQQKMTKEFNIPRRITHNDTKISNILLTKNSNQAKALIDWDTIMPGYWLFDYGDMVRSFTPLNNEDGKSSQAPELRFDILQATTEGYLSACGDHLSLFEKENLLKGAQIIIFMLGVRFLSDYLNGDVYFKTEHEDHNLARCKNQFALLNHLDIEYHHWQQKLGLLIS